MNIQPKQNFVQGTRELMNSIDKPEIIELLGLKIQIDPEVFNPNVFFSSQWFAQEIANLVKKEGELIEVGCGTGIVSVYILTKNSNIKVYATDINPKAKELTVHNTQDNRVGGRIKVFCGDVFDALPNGVVADSIFWAMPFGFLSPEEQLKERDWQVFDPGYRAIRKFFKEAKNFLKPNGRLLIGFSKDIGHLELLESIAQENNFSLHLLKETKGVEKNSVSMEIWESKLLQQ